MYKSKSTEARESAPGYGYNLPGHVLDRIHHSVAAAAINNQITLGGELMRQPTPEHLDAIRRDLGDVVFSHLDDSYVTPEVPNTIATLHNTQPAHYEAQHRQATAA